MTSLLAPLGVLPDRASQQDTIIGNKSPIITTVEVESPPSSGDESGSSSDWLVVSPYTERQHQLDLQTVDTPFRLLALALVKLDSATPDYATATYENAFKWSDLFAELKTLAQQHGYRWTRQDFYVVEFRSKLKPNIDRPLLFTLDKQSHIEATASGGLLKYWFGEPDSERRNLATCLWRSKQDAINGGTGPWHKQARACIPNMYESIDVHGVRLTVEDNIESWSFSPWPHRQP